MWRASGLTTNRSPSRIAFAIRILYRLERLQCCDVLRRQTVCPRTIDEESFVPGVRTQPASDTVRVSDVNPAALLADVWNMRRDSHRRIALLPFVEPLQFRLCY